MSISNPYTSGSISFFSPTTSVDLPSPSPSPSSLSSPSQVPTNQSDPNLLPPPEPQPPPSPTWPPTRTTGFGSAFIPGPPPVRMLLLVAAFLALLLLIVACIQIRRRWCRRRRGGGRGGQVSTEDSNGRITLGAAVAAAAGGGGEVGVGTGKSRGLSLEEIEGLGQTFRFGAGGPADGPLRRGKSVENGGETADEEAGMMVRECAVCLGEYTESDVLRRIDQCGHSFHRECIDAWLGGRSSCPVCRAELGIRKSVELGARAGVEQSDSAAPGEGIPGMVPFSAPLQ